MTDKQIIVFDLDGTAIDSPKQKSPGARLVQAAKKLKGNYHLSVATGRPWAYAGSIMQALGLTDPCIIASGTQICNPQTGEILWQEDLDFAATQKAVTVLRSHPELLKSSGCKILLNDYGEHEHFNGGVAVRDLYVDEPIYLMTIVFVPDAVADEVFAQLSAVPNIICSLVVAQAPGCKDIHITAKGASKKYAVTRLLAMVGLEKGATIGVGDGHNDLHLFDAVKHRVAMGNAVAELKAAAHEIIQPVHKEGLALFFEDLLAGYRPTGEPSRSRASRSTP